MMEKDWKHEILLDAERNIQRFLSCEAGTVVLSVPSIMTRLGNATYDGILYFKTSGNTNG